MVIENLFEYFVSIGQSLPSIAERGKLYEQKGLGLASSYKGTASQNIALLEILQSNSEKQAPIEFQEYISQIEQYKDILQQQTINDILSVLNSGLNVSLPGVNFEDINAAINIIRSFPGNMSVYDFIINQFSSQAGLGSETRSFVSGAIGSFTPIPVEAQWYANQQGTTENSYTSPKYTFDSLGNWQIADVSQSIQSKIDNVKNAIKTGATISQETRDEIKYYFGQGKDAFLDGVVDGASDIGWGIVKKYIPVSISSTLQRTETVRSAYQKWVDSDFGGLFGAFSRFGSSELDPNWGNENPGGVSQLILDLLPALDNSGVAGNAVNAINRTREILLHSDIQLTLEDSSQITKFITPAGHSVAAYAANAGDHLIGGTLADALGGRDGADILEGMNGNDILSGGRGNDRLSGGGGMDKLIGGDGIDTAIYSSVHAAYLITIDPINTVVRDRFNLYRFNPNLGEGIDQLIQVERAQFNDGVVALDINGTAGQVYRLYQAAFARTPDIAGLKHNINLVDNGMTIQRMSKAFLDSAEFQQRYGVDVSDIAYVNALYKNVLGRDADAAGLDGWISLLAEGSWDRTMVLVGFSESTENIVGVAPAIANGIFIG